MGERPPGGTDPVSLQQEQIWFLTRLAPDRAAHRAQVSMRIVGPLDLDLLDAALTELVRRHEILRTSFPEVDGGPVQLVHPPHPVRARRVDAGDLPSGADDPRAAVLADEMRRPFAVERLPLTRWTVLRVADDEHTLVVVQSHLLHDDRSVAVLLRELAALYDAAAAGTPSTLGEPVAQYRDAARWQRAALGSERGRAALAHRAEQLADLPPPPDLPLDRPRPAVRGVHTASVPVTVPAGTAHGVHETCRTRGASVLGTTLAAFLALLCRYTGQRDLCVGSLFGGRTAPRTRDLPGRFADTVPLRIAVDPAAGFGELVDRVTAVLADAAAHEVPFPELVRVLNPAREPGRSPLTDIRFSVRDTPAAEWELGGARAVVTEHAGGSAAVDLDVVVTPGADGRIGIVWEYASDLFDHRTIDRLAQAHLRLLADASIRPAAPLHGLALLAPRERELVLRDWNPDRRPPPAGPLVQDAVRARAAAAPGAPAVHAGDRVLSYAELVGAADALAARLRAAGVRRGAVVGIFLPRGADLVVAELAVLVAGAAYLPIDIENPPARLADQYASSEAVLLITQSRVAARLPDGVRHLSTDRPPTGDDGPAPGADGPAPPATHDDLAYLIATSGSTGRPKIVMIDHRSLCNAVAWRRRRCDLGPADRIAQVASPGFDTSVMDIWPTLVSGATLYVPDDDTRLDPERLRSWLVDERITVTELPTALAERVLSLPWPTGPALRELITGGDRLRVRPAAGLPFRVLNEYGPSEATATSTAGHVAAADPADPGVGLPDIGRPITGVSTYVLDPWRQPVPPGATGELWIGGAGVALGYRGNPALTAERFVPDPFAEVGGARMYRTGDLARHLPDGRLAFLGRRDRQLKLRGYRIEPNEIAEALRTHPEVSDAVVVLRTDGGERSLVGYLEAPDGPTLRRRVREHLADRLPRYMIPAGFVVLDALPLTINGKVDQRALPPYTPDAPGAGSRAPGTGTERWLAELWRAVLQVDTIGVAENFFDVGGHSLLLAAVRRGIAEHGHDLPMVALFEHPTIEDLARHLDRPGTEPATGGQDGPPARLATRRGRLERRRAVQRPTRPG